MGKHGLGHGVARHKDPTFEQALANFRREARENKKRQQAANSLACIKAVRFYLKLNGYELADDLAIRDLYTGDVYRSVVPAAARAPRPADY